MEELILVLTIAHRHHLLHPHHIFPYQHDLILQILTLHRILEQLDVFPVPAYLHSEKRRIFDKSKVVSIFAYPKNAFSTNNFAEVGIIITEDSLYSLPF